ncbi:MAG: acyltransferase [Lachnospiraceae bacterium]|nr:acyltransferase [Lachnospiraceae bacterium]
MTDSRSENTFLYNARGAACIMVVFIHCMFPGRFGGAVQALARFAVPLFFAMSGYFLVGSKGCGTDSETIRNTCVKRLKALLGTTAFVWLVYTLYSMIIRIISGQDPLLLFKEKFAPAELVRFFLFGSGRIVYDPEYSYDFMWYLFAMIYVYLFVYAAAGIIGRIWKPVCLILLCFLYGGIILQIRYPVQIFGISIRTWYVLRNWLFVGIPFFLLGYGFRRTGKDTGKPGSIAAALMIAAGAVCEIAGYLRFGPHEIHAGSLLIVAGCLTAAGNDRGVKLPFLYRTGRYYAGGVYYWHVLVLSVFTRCFAYFYLKAEAGLGETALRFWNGVYPYFLPLIICLLTLLLTAAVQKKESLLQIFHIRL